MAEGICPVWSTATNNLFFVAGAPRLQSFVNWPPDQPPKPGQGCIVPEALADISLFSDDFRISLRKCRMPWMVLIFFRKYKIRMMAWIIPTWSPWFPLGSEGLLNDSRMISLISFREWRIWMMVWKISKSFPWFPLGSEGCPECFTNDFLLGVQDLHDVRDDS